MALRPNFVVDTSGVAKVLRKPKVIAGIPGPRRAQQRRMKAWFRRAEARLAQASTLQECMQVINEIEIAQVTQPWLS